MKQRIRVTRRRRRKKERISFENFVNLPIGEEHSDAEASQAE